MKATSRDDKLLFWFVTLRDYKSMKDYENFEWLKEAIEIDFGRWQIEQIEDSFLEKELNRYFSIVGNGQKQKTMRAKFKGDFVKDYGYGSKEVQLSAVYSNKKNTEDNEFSQATPSGTITMMISNPKAFDFIKPGEQYYVDFTLVAKEDHY